MCRIGLAIALALPIAVQARAQDLFNKPVYFETTKSYFEMVQAPAGSSVRGADLREIGWERAAGYAASRKFKGVSGRLAVVRTPGTQDFLMRTFKPRERSLIGLRYYCEYHKLLWVTGEELPLSNYANWGRPWSVGTACKDNGKYASVFIAGSNHLVMGENDRLSTGRWYATGMLKEFYQFFVEYPTGKP